MASETAKTQEDFRQRLLERDLCCVWTGLGAVFNSAMHIIPYSRGPEVHSTI